MGLDPIVFRKGRLGFEELKAVRRVLESGDLSPFFKSFKGGPMVQQFESDFAKYHGVKHAVSTSSGTTALHTALLALGVKEGDKIVTTPYTFVATASSIIMCGAEPVFCDVNPYTYNIDVEELRKTLKKNSDVKGIIPVHLLGQACDMEIINELAKEHGLFVLEDAAQALGGEYLGKKTGTMGDMAMFSFQQSKTITTGEGGMIITDNDTLYERCCWLRNHGEKYSPRQDLWNSENPPIGYNYRLTELQAAIGIEQLKKLDDLNNLQIRNAEYMCENLPETIKPPLVATYTTKHTLYLIGCNWNQKATKLTREQFIQELQKRGISKGVPGQNVSAGYNKLIYEHPVIRRFKTPCPTAESLLKTSLWFDIHRFNKTITQMQEYCNSFKEVVG